MQGSRSNVGPTNEEDIDTLFIDDEYRVTENPVFNRSTAKYRVKPKSTYRPFKTKKECWNEMHKHPDFGWVMTKSKDYLNITEIYFNGIGFPPYDIGEGHSMSEDYNFNKSFSHFTFTDEEPFGIKEE